MESQCSSGSCQCVFPTHNLLGVNVPVYLQDGNPAEAIACLGGIDSIYLSYLKSFKTENISVGRSKKSELLDQRQPDRLRLHLRRQDAYSVPIVSDKPTHTRDLVVKISYRRLESSSLRPKSESADSKRQQRCIVDIEPVGIVNRTYQFTKLADFQYLPPVQETGGRFSGLDSAFGLFENDDLDDTCFDASVSASIYRLTPMQFSRVSTVRIPYNYKQYADTDYQRSILSLENSNGQEEEAHSWSQEKNNTEENESLEMRRAAWRSSVGVDRRSDPLRTAFLSHRVAMNAEDVPKQADEDKWNAAKAIPGDILQRLNQAFEERAVWTRRALLLHSGAVDESHLKMALPALAYTFDGPGPFRTCWIKYGYDPRKDPTSSRLQVIECRLNGALADVVEEKRKRIDNAQEEFSEKANVTLCQLPTHRHLFLQLCDIEYEPIKELLSSSSLLTVFCKDKRGWFSSDTWNSFRTLLQEHIMKLIRVELGEETLQQVTISGKQFRDKSARKKRLRRLRSLKSRLFDATDSSAYDRNTVHFRNRSESLKTCSHATSDSEPTDILHMFSPHNEDLDEYELLEED
eukprot:jgi/Galph1/5800/GphlegSOOS_G4422.1